jgi:LysR family transcriptional activator of dmlA
LKWLPQYSRIVNETPSLDDLRVFCVVARKASFIAAADELSFSAAYVSKRVAVLEQRLGGTRLLNRSTRRVSVTEAGERVFEWATKILDDVEHLVEDVSTTRRVPRGTLRVSSSFGFGRHVVGPALSRLTDVYPQLNVRFDLFDRLVDIGGDGVDLDIRVGDEIAPHLIARKLASNHRVLCAAPSYLDAQLATHQCLAIKERDHPFGLWRLTEAGVPASVKVNGPLATNDGEVAVQWALEGRGIVLRSMWNVRPYLESGRLRQVLPTVIQPANVWAVYPARLASSAKVRVCVDFLTAEFAKTLPP